MEYEKPKKKRTMKVREAALRYLPSAEAAKQKEEEWVSAADFKTHCLRLIERVERERGEVVVTRYGKPVARLVPYGEEPPSLRGHVAGAVSFYGDLVSPVDEAWDADA